MKNPILIGKKVKIISATNASLYGLEGKIVNETKHTIGVLTSSGVKKIIKNGCVFEIEGQKIVGRDINVAAHERIKLK
jgi:RNase P/RNase MRP subunit p29